jgi:hypothetical protein
MASSHIPLFPEAGERPTPPPARSAPPETPPPAPHTGTIPSEAAEPGLDKPGLDKPGLDETRARPISDQAAAGIAESWFAGDAAEKYKLPPAESPDDAIRKLTANLGVASRFAEYVEIDGRISHVDLETRAIDPKTGEPAKVEVRFEMVDSLPRENGIMPVAMYEPAGPNEYIVRVSKGAPAISLKRGIAHELVEIHANHLTTEVPQEHALAPNSKATKLSPHDEGRLAEMRVLAEDLHTARGADREALLDEAQKLAAHLGLTGNTEDAAARRELAFGHLGKGLPENWLKVAISGSEENPLRQRVQGDLSKDLNILSKRIELAQQLGELSSNREGWLKWEKNPIVSDAVEIMRQSLIRDDYFIFKGSGGGVLKMAKRDELLKLGGPPGSVERFVFDEALERAKTPRTAREDFKDPGRIDPSTVRATQVMFGENEHFQDWETFRDTFAEKNPGSSVPDPSPTDPDRRRIMDQVRLRELFDRWTSGSYVDEKSGTGRVLSVFSDELTITPGFEAKFVKNPAETLAFQLATEISIRSYSETEILPAEEAAAKRIMLETLPVEEAAAKRFKMLEDASDLVDPLEKAVKAGDTAKVVELRVKLKRLRQGARFISEDFGVEAGKAFAASNFRNAEIVEAKGARVFDLVVKQGDDFVLIECKGGASGLGKRLSSDRDIVVQQGTREYAMAVAQDMVNSGDEKLAPIGRDLLDKLNADPNYKPKYYVVRQDFDGQGRPTPPTVDEFDMTANKRRKE